MEFNNGNTYTGDWKDDAIDGKGVFEYSNGDKYEGELENGIMNGKGKFMKYLRRLLLFYWGVI